MSLPMRKSLSEPSALPLLTRKKERRAPLQPGFPERAAFPEFRWPRDESPAGGGPIRIGPTGGNPRFAGKPPRTAQPCQCAAGALIKTVKARLPERRDGPQTCRSDAYFVIFETTPEPTVRPPSRIAKRRPSSIAIGAISLTPIVTLSPGMTISVPSGRTTSPVTSVVRK